MLSSIFIPTPVIEFLITFREFGQLENALCPFTLKVCHVLLLLVYVAVKLPQVFNASEVQV